MNHIVEKVVALKKEGLNQNQIAERLGIGQTSVSRHLRNAGIESDRVWNYERRHKCAELYKSGMTTEEVAKAMGTSRNRVRDALKVVGVPRRSKAAFSKGESNPSWNGGKMIDPDGYILIWMPEHPMARLTGYVCEHRLVMSAVLGRTLKKNEVVHHKNGDTSDNRPDNLEVFDSNSKHLAETLKGKCPKWTAEGIRRMKEKREQHRELLRNKRRSKTDEAQSS